MARAHEKSMGELSLQLEDAQSAHKKALMHILLKAIEKKKSNISEIEKIFNELTQTQRFVLTENDKIRILKEAIKAYMRGPKVRSIKQATVDFLLDKLRPENEEEAKNRKFCPFAYALEESTLCYEDDEPTDDEDIKDTLEQKLGTLWGCINEVEEEESHYIAHANVPKILEGILNNHLGKLLASSIDMWRGRLENEPELFANALFESYHDDFCFEFTMEVLQLAKDNKLKLSWKNNANQSILVTFVECLFDTHDAVQLEKLTTFLNALWDYSKDFANENLLEKISSQCQKYMERKGMQSTNMLKYYWCIHTWLSSKVMEAKANGNWLPNRITDAMRTQIEIRLKLKNKDADEVSDSDDDVELEEIVAADSLASSDDDDDDYDDEDDEDEEEEEEEEEEESPSKKRRTA